MKVKDVIFNLFGMVVIENKNEDDVLFHFSNGWGGGNAPENVLNAEVLKMYADDGVLFVTTDIE